MAATTIKVLASIDPMGATDDCRIALGPLWQHVAGREEQGGGRGGSGGSGGSSESSGGGSGSSGTASKAAAAAQHLSWLWQPAPDASLRLFKLDFNSSASTAKQYPLIAALQKHEDRLPLIDCVADVLRWHAILFRALRHGIRRDEAANLTNAQAIARLPSDQQAQARQVLLAFCDSFNRSFVLVERLFECQVPR